MPQAKKARAIGFNHVALEVGDIDEALAFYGRLFDFELRGRSKTSAFIDLGDQFLALQKGRAQAADGGRHFGLVVDDKDAVRRALAEAGVDPLPGSFLDFHDPWGTTTTSSSPRRRTCCAGWACRIFARTAKRSRSLPTRAWRRTEGRPSEDGHQREALGIGWRTGRRAAPADVAHARIVGYDAATIGTI